MATKYEVSFKLRSADRPFEDRKVTVEAINRTDALIQASSALEQQGHTHWDLIGIVPITN